MAIIFVMCAFPTFAKDKVEKTTLGDLECSVEQIAMFDGQAWVCVDRIPGCPTDMVRVGSLCVDIHEASVWNEAGDTQYGVGENDYPCSDDGADCDGIFARSVFNVFPSRFISWFQAQQACANVGKRLPTNAEWQMAAAGTPEPVIGGCNAGFNSSEIPVPTGSSNSTFQCSSRWGVVDMVGNLAEWVTDWQQTSDTAFASRQNCGTWGKPGFEFSDDLMCLTLPDAQVATMPMALVRGHSFARTGFNTDTSPGPFSLDLEFPDSNNSKIGFRCVK